MSPTRDQIRDGVLRDLATVVDTMATATANEAALLGDLAAGHETYVSSVRSMLTGEGGAGVPIATSTALKTTNALGDNITQMTGALADRTVERGNELEQVKKKEQEEKGTGESGTSPPPPKPGVPATPAGPNAVPGGFID